MTKNDNATYTTDGLCASEYTYVFIYSFFLLKTDIACYVFRQQHSFLKTNIVDVRNGQTQQNK